MRRFLSVLISTSFLLTPTLSMADNADMAPPSVSPPPVEAEHGMVVSSQHYASQVGADVLKAGGNAIDAAVAVGYALAVTHPCCGNIGGGGFATIHLANGKDTFIDFREKAPGAATENMYLDAKGNIIPNLSLFGYKGVGVPGSVMGFQMMLDKYGTMKREQLIAPAIKLADNGFVLKAGDISLLNWGTEYFKKQPNVAAIFLNHGQRYKVGETLVQKQLAATASADDCANLFEARPDELSFEAARLDDGHWLVSVMCWQAAYNEGYAYWVIHAQPPFAPVLVTTDGSGYADGGIASSQKGRGLGDCLSSERWTWDGRQFVQTALSGSGMCKLMAPGGAWELPTLVTGIR